MCLLNMCSCMFLMRRVLGIADLRLLIPTWIVRAAERAPSISLEDAPRAPVPAYILLNSLPLFSHICLNISSNLEQILHFAPTDGWQSAEIAITVDTHLETIFVLSLRSRSRNWYWSTSRPRKVWTQLVRSRQSVQLVLTVPNCSLQLGSLSCRNHCK